MPETIEDLINNKLNCFKNLKTNKVERGKQILKIVNSKIRKAEEMNELKKIYNQKKFGKTVSKFFERLYKNILGANDMK